MLFPASGFSQEKVYIPIDSPSGTRLPIALQDLIGSKATSSKSDKPEAVNKKILDKINKDFRFTVTGDLDFSGFFRVLDKEAFIESAKVGIKKHETNFYSWRVIGAEILVKGMVHIKEDKFYLTIRVFDTLKEESIMNKRYSGYNNNATIVAHRFSDDLMESLTGVRGIFSTKFAFVSPSGGNKEVYISDYDGRNTKKITANGSINLSPKWSPDGRKLIFTSYYKGRPQLFEVILKTNETIRLSYKRGLNISGRWSPDGKHIALALSVDGNSEIYTINRENLRYTRLTNSWSLDVSPTWSPDGKRIAYTSNRAGNPHIYVINSNKSRGFDKPKRVTFGGKYNANPQWSPDGQWILYEGLSGNNFQIWKVRPDGSDATILTSGANSEMPSWSPDGRYIVYSSGKGRDQSLFIMRADGSGHRKITTGIGMEQMPDWSPYP